MLVAGTVFLVGVGVFFLAHRRWGFPLVGAIVLPVLAVASLWDLAMVPVFLLGSVGAYAGFAISQDRVSDHPHRTELVAVVVVGIVLILGVITALVGPAITRSLGWRTLLSTILAGIVGYTLFTRDPERRWVEAGIGLLGLAGLMITGLVLVWVWMNPPSVSQLVLGVSLADVGPRSVLPAANADALGLVGTISATLTVGPVVALS